MVSRKTGEELFIADNIKVVIIDISQGRVRIGIEAPREIPILRWELLRPDDPRLLPLMK